MKILEFVDARMTSAWKIFNSQLSIFFKILKQKLGTKGRVFVLIVLLVAFIFVGSFGFHGSLELSYFAFGVLALTIIIALFVKSDQKWRHSFESSAALLSTVALFLAGYWYVFERSGVPKIDVRTHGDVWVLEPDRVLVRTTLELENVGSTAIDLRKQKEVKIFIGQILPFQGKHADELNADFDRRTAIGKKSFLLRQTDNWPQRGWIELNVPSIIESGETETLYFKSLVTCRDGLVLSITAKVPKKDSTLDRFLDKLLSRGSKQMYWINQSKTDEIAKCD